MNHKKTQLATLEKNLPPVIARKDIDKYLGGLISSGYLANLDREGVGPKSLKSKSQRRVAYLREDLIAWLGNWLDD